jgi:hypothetical protein
MTIGIENLRYSLFILRHVMSHQSIQMFPAFASGPQTCCAPWLGVEPIKPLRVSGPFDDYSFYVFLSAIA